ncbi:MAG: histidinol-phosphate transaminase [Deltaproteobacteria bacterium RBG_13_52_11]|nr:MAG: histidinol-phosphate transaminase [Deltaproteobacteria bacterium RBG_13_52_11]
MSDLKDMVADYILNLPPYPKGREWRAGEHLIRLSANENPLGPSPKALAAITKALKTIHRYPDGAGGVLKEKLARRLEFPPDHIILGNGSNEIFELAARTFLQREEEVLLPDPTFAYYRIAAQAQGGRCVSVPLRDFKIDLSEIAKKVNSKTKLIFLSNPNNPTGTIFTRSEFDDFLTHLPSHVVVLVDEAYGEYVTALDYPLSQEYWQRERWIITTKTFSKFYGLAGLRIGYGVARKELIEHLEKVRQPFSVNLLAQMAAEAALEDEEHREKTARINEVGKRYLYEELTSLGLSFVPSEANFILVHFGPHVSQVMEGLMRKGIVVRGMAGYGLKEYIRVTIGLPEDNTSFIEALKRWKKGS